MLRWLHVGLVLACSVANVAHAQVWADGRDPWTLLQQTLVDRDLAAQLAAPGQAFRLGRHLGMVSLAADTWVGGEAAPKGSHLTRFHGYFLLNGFAAVQPLAGLELSLNLTLLNPSASDGYRVSDQVLPGVALSLHRDLFTIGGAPLRIDFVGLDLDLVTVGDGLLLEQVPLEGHMAGVSWNGFYLRETFGGRAFWEDDDFLAVTLGALGGRVQAYFVDWLLGETPPPSGIELLLPATSPPRVAATYGGVALNWPLGRHFRVAAEYAAHVRGSAVKNGFLLRGDFLDRHLGRLQLHVGVQQRFYQKGFGPRDSLVTPNTSPNIPLRENVYVTNSFEFFGISKYYNQWSTTGMIEARFTVLPWLRLLAEAEYWVRVVTDTRRPQRVLYLPRGGRAPGVWQSVYYRGGIEIYPWPTLPHRVSVLFTNKLVASAASAVQPDPQRFDRVPVFLFEAEVFL